MKKVIVSAFEPFDNAKTNPSYEVAKLLPEKIGEADIEVMRLPVVFGLAASILETRIDECRPDAIIMLGVAGTRTKITPEVIAVNIDDARIPDNQGNNPKFEKIDSDGADGIFSTLPVTEIVGEMTKEGIASELSYSAGAYVCNDLFYRIMNYLKTKDLCIPAGFIHVPNPSDSEEITKSELSISEIARGIQVCIETITNS
ncbi:pyroglutamyl-peptidase I [Butyrivibrio sp. INlla16]|uniref:pyroglutamyl-peptidase I n=1 Tax=Butyrivibrio sp. INlla16 TaxID=1520807 RepID=UPI0008805EE2|nr:pyroglutamyl-peptidase I [Butyrivibrio sp. INlla16]SDB56554.1 pyroglutamyl-peptidase [Butyrivibrio sp. INlla16]